MSEIKMNRRTSLKYLSGGAFQLMFVGGYAMAHKALHQKAFKSEKYSYCQMVQTSSNEFSLQDDKRTPFHWDVCAIGNENKPLLLKPIESSLCEKVSKHIRFRIAVALDERLVKNILVRIANTNIIVGLIEIKYSPVFQVHECQIHQELLPQINKNGLELYITDSGEAPLWIFGGKQADNQGNIALLPHILFSEDINADTKTFLDQFFSINSVQPFDWMEGCVLDGLWQIYQQKSNKKAKQTIETHLNHYFQPDGNLIIENPKSIPIDNEVHGIESTLPYAIVAQFKPQHPILDKAIKYWEDHTKDDGSVVDFVAVTAEGSYTIAYPMVVLGLQRNREDLIQSGITQVRIRMKRLFHNGDFYLRCYNEERKTYKNWARGVAWNLLGLGRTIALLKDRKDIENLKKTFTEAALEALSYQNKEGLWHCFIDNPTIRHDTSGSAGIAAAIATGINLGLIPDIHRKDIHKTWNALGKYLTPDGLLTGVAPSNRKGEELQRSKYRVISQMGMGLMAQLYAFIGE